MLKSLFGDQDEFFLPERLISEINPKVLEIPKEHLKNQDRSRPRELETMRRS